MVRSVRLNVGKRIERRDSGNREGYVGKSTESQRENAGWKIAKLGSSSHLTEATAN